MRSFHFDILNYTDGLFPICMHEKSFFRKIFIVLMKSVSKQNFSFYRTTFWFLKNSSVIAMANRFPTLLRGFFSRVLRY